MNHLYRIVFNRSTGVYQAVCETARAACGGKASTAGESAAARLPRMRLTALACLLAGAAPGALAGDCLATDQNTLEICIGLVTGTDTITLRNDIALSGAPAGLASGVTVVSAGHTLTGTGRLNLGEGTYRSTADSTLQGTPGLMNFTGTNGALAAAAGTTLTVTGGFVTGNDAVVNFGSATDTGTIHFTQTTLQNVGSNVRIVVKGGTVIDDGVLAQTAARSLSTTIMAGATLQFTSAFLNELLGAGTLITGSVVNIASGIFSGSIRGAGTIIKSTPGTLVLSGSGLNTYTGATQVAVGTLQAGAANVLPTGSALQLSGGSTFDLNNFNQSVGTLGSASAGDTLSLGSATLTTSMGTDNNFTGAITGTGSLVKTGTGTLFLIGDSTYSGTTTISSGGLRLGNGGTTGSLGTGNIINNGTLTARRSDPLALANNISGTGSLIQAGNGTLTLTGTNTYSGGTTVSAGTLLGNSTSLQGAITNNAAVTFDQNTNGTYSGVMSGSGSLTKNGTGNLTLSGASTYSGATTVSDGSLQTNGINILSASSAVTVGPRGLLHMLGLNQTIGSLAGGGWVHFAQARLTTGGDNSSTTFSGQFTGSLGGFTKNGSGTMTLTGTSSYGGGTTLNAGGLRLGNTAALGTGALTVGGASTLGSTTAVTINNNVSLNAALTVDGSNDLTLGGTVSSMGGLTKTGTAVLTLAGTNTYTGGTTVNGGTLRLGAGSTLATGSSATVATGATLDLNGNNQALGSLTGAGNVALGTATLSIGTGAVNVFGGNISGTGGGLAKTGTGVLELSGSNTYSGATTIDGGYIQASGSSSLSAASALTVNALGTLNVSGANAIGSLAGLGAVILDANLTTGANNSSTVYGGTASGAGRLAKTGTGTMTLTGASNYTGATAVNGGKLVVDGSISGAGAVSVAGAATLAGKGTLAGAVTVANGGALDLQQGQTLGTGALTLDAGSRINAALGVPSLSPTALLQVNGNLALNGSVNVTDAGGLGVGVYRLIGYTGLLSGSGLTVGSTPAASSFGVQTSVDKQVNLVNTAGQVLQFWDGSAAGNTNNGLIDGGTGTWTATAGNWTVLSGVANAAMAPAPGFAIFQGAAGTVIADASAGALAVTGMQFASHGYTLKGDAIALAGTEAIVRVGDGSATPMTATVESTLSGAARLNKMGDGTLVLAGANSYSGGTTISAGTLQIGQGGATGSITGDVVNNGALAFNRSGVTGFAGAVSGTGSLVQNGPGTLVLSGANSYTGGTTVTAGTLQGNSASLQGNISNNAAVTFDQAAAGTYAGAMSGTGSLSKQGAGTLVLSGINSYTGGTTVTAGALQGNSASLQGNISNNAAVTFDQAAAGTYAGAMSGTGSFTKTGAGKLVLSGANSYSGATAVNAGTLSVNGSIANSAVSVNNGGTLGGSGTVGSTSIAAGGVLAPGNSIGTLAVNGNLTLAAGALYRVEVDGTGASDRVTATGTATLNGTLDLQAGAGGYAAETSYSILNAAGGISGSFAGVTSSLAFLTPSLSYNATGVLLKLARNDTSFSAVASTPNQVAVATALQNTGGAGDMETVQKALLGMSAAQARSAYDAASGMGIATLQRATAGFAAGFGNQLQARLGAQAAAASGFANSFTGRPLLLAANDHLSDLMAPVSDSAPQKFSLAGGAASLSSSPDGASKGLWIRGYGGYGNTDSDGNSAASRLRSSGLSIGFDTDAGEGLRLGAAVTSGSARLSTDNNESGKTRSSAVALYGSYADGPWNFSGSASLGWGKSHMDRNIAFGALNRVASSDFDNSTLYAYGEATYSMPMDGWTLQPLAGLALGRSKADGFTETGAGALNLQVAGQTINSSKAMLGAKASIDAGRVRFEPRLVWAHEFGDLNTPMAALFQGATTVSPFQALGTALKRDTLILGLGATGSIAKGVDLFADVQAEHNSAQRNLAVLVGLRSRW